MTDNILEGTKKILGLAPDYDAFDHDVMTHINTALATLTQIGVGPAQGFMIESGDEEWGTFLGEDVALNPVKTYIYMKVRMAFDPPTTAFHLSSLKEQIQEMEWRLQVTADPPPLILEPGAF